MKLLSRLISLAIPTIASFGIVAAASLVPAYATTPTVKVESVTFISPAASSAPNPQPSVTGSENVNFNVSSVFKLTGGDSLTATIYTLTWGTKVTCAGALIEVQNQSCQVQTDTYGEAHGMGGVAGPRSIPRGMQTANAHSTVSLGPSSDSGDASVSFWVGPQTAPGTPADPKPPVAD